jgi:uncharacterized heparinase superfamily protein
VSALAWRLRRALTLPPGVVVRRLGRELREEFDRFTVPARLRRFEASTLLAATACGSLPELWERLLTRPYPFWAAPLEPRTLEQLAGAGERARILAAAERAARHEVDLLGSGPIVLGAHIDWQRDFKTGLSFPPAYFRDIDYMRLDEPCDVKVPWELSRLQWLIPAGQAWLLTGDERYAALCREVLEQWIAANPCALSVNWACTMEAALRLFSFSWLLRACGRSRAWADAGFQARFLRCLYLHGEFTERYIERASINGNHFTADAAALVFAGLLFGEGAAPRRWAERGWQELGAEITRQVFPDGVDFEASVPYHRLVQELFLYPAWYRRVAGLDVPPAYAERLRAMARYTAAYSRGDGSSPIWGDNDDGRALPFGGQPNNDHRYLVQAAATFFDDATLGASVGGDHSELLWLAGPQALAARAAAVAAARPPPSTAFRDGGFFIMRNAVDHVFIDCGPLGLAGRGGHGHNDLLSFEATLASTLLISDSGSFHYTGSALERDRFRSTAYHNTPQVDDEEINRFRGPGLLWDLHNDARFELRAWQTGAQCDEFRGAHDGYARLSDPVEVERRIVLEHDTHRLTVTDRIRGAARHQLSVRYHLAPGVEVERVGPAELKLTAGGKRFSMRWSGGDGWSVRVEPGRTAPAYGTAVPRLAVVLECAVALPCELQVELTPGN